MFYKWGETMKRRKGGQPGNKNALGNRGGAPHGNRNAVTHGLYSRTGIFARNKFEYDFLSESDKKLFDEILKDAGNNMESAQNLFRVVKFENNSLPICKNPYAAIVQSTQIMINELSRLSKGKKTDD